MGHHDEGEATAVLKLAVSAATGRSRRFHLLVRPASSSSRRLQLQAIADLMLAALIIRRYMVISRLGFCWLKR